VPLYWIFISHTILMMIFCRAHTVVHTIFCFGSCLVGVGLMWTWGLFLHWSRIDEFVLGLKSVDELCHSPPMGIGSADTSQPPKGEICMDKSQLPSNPAVVPLHLCTNEVYHLLVLFLYRDRMPDPWKCALKREFRKVPEDVRWCDNLQLEQICLGQLALSALE
jgi:hypothetical protein